MWEYSVSERELTHSSKRASSLFLGAVIAVLGCVSAPAFAGPHVPFSVSGTISTIDTGDVKPAGQSGRFIVRDRQITGAFMGSISAPFVITFDTNVPLATQAGRIHGRLIAGVYEANVTMASSTGPTPVECPMPDGVTCIATPGGNFVPGLLLNGRMNFLSGAKGQGSVTGWLIPIIDEQGHIVSIVASELAISGQWMQ
jgi:hypothetical protein